MTIVLTYTALVHLFAFLSVITPGEIKMLFLGLEFGVLIGEVIYAIGIARSDI